MTIIRKSAGEPSCRLADFQIRRAKSEPNSPSPTEGAPPPPQKKVSRIQQSLLVAWNSDKSDSRHHRNTILTLHRNIRTVWSKLYLTNGSCIVAHTNSSRTNYSSPTNGLLATNGVLTSAPTPLVIVLLVLLGLQFRSGDKPLNL